MTPQDMVQTLLMVGWRQKEISDAVGLTQPNISRIASGKQGVRWQYWVALEKLLNETPPRLKAKIIQAAREQA